MNKGECTWGGKNKLGLFLILALSILYTIFFRNFAKYPLFIIPKLGLPVFTGELIFVVCFILAIPGLLDFLKRYKRISILFVLPFTAFLIFKVVAGLSNDYGALVFRNAALFYYSYFALFAFIFYPRKPSLFRNKSFLDSLYILILLLTIFEKFNQYFVFMYVMVLSILALKASRGIFNYIMRFIPIVGVFIYPYPFLKLPFWYANRGLVIGYLSGLVYLLISSLFFLRLQKRIKQILLIATITAIFLFFVVPKSRNLFFTSLNVSYSKIIFSCDKVAEQAESLNKKSAREVLYLFEPPKEGQVHAEAIQVKMRGANLNELFTKEMIGLSKELTEEISIIRNKLTETMQSTALDKKTIVSLESLQKRLKKFNDNFNPRWNALRKSISLESSKMHASINRMASQINGNVGELRKIELWLDSKIASLQKLLGAEREMAFGEIRDKSMQLFDEVIKDTNEVKTLSKKIKQPSKLGAKHSLNNAVWRIIVWREMLKQYREGSLLFGNHFGKPFRCEILVKRGWDHGIDRVGWLEPHNSYLHMLFRGGFFGISFALITIIAFISLAVTFIKRRAIVGLLLTSALFLWLVIANFMVFLELPYFAIPFWSLFGITLAYAYKNNEVRCEK